MRDLMPEAWQPQLQTRILGRADNIVRHTMTSTNTVLKELAREGTPHGSVRLCECQTSGRGRLDRSWSSPAGAGIWCSVLLRPRLSPERVPMTTFCAALAMAQAVRFTCGQEIRIKWPNDVILRDRKVCGVLLEMGFDAAGDMFVIVGTGLNIRRNAYPADLTDRAIALEEVCAPPERSEIIAAYLNALEASVDALEQGNLSGILKPYHDYSCTLGRRVQVIGPEACFTGDAVDVDETGALLVRTESGETRRVLAGDVSVRGMMGYV